MLDDTETSLLKCLDTVLYSYLLPFSEVWWREVVMSVTYVEIQHHHKIDNNGHKIKSFFRKIRDRDLVFWDLCLQLPVQCLAYHG